MIKNIIFDLGGVVMTLDPDEAVKRFRDLGLKDAARQLDSYTQAGIFGDLEHGKISAETFRLELSRMVKHELTWEDCRHAWLGYAKEVPRRNLDALKSLRADGYRLILLSNTNPYMMSWAMSPAFDGEGHAVTYYMDACYLSYLVGAMKPDRLFFQYVLDVEQIVPEESLFLDDGPRNVEVAESMGIHTFCPENGADWTKEIYEYLNVE